MSPYVGCKAPLGGEVVAKDAAHNDWMTVSRSKVQQHVVTAEVLAIFLKARRALSTLEELARCEGLRVRVVVSRRSSKKLAFADKADAYDRGRC